MGKRSPGPMSYIREASALRNIKLCYAGRSFSIRVVSRCLHIKLCYAGRSFSIRVVIRCLRSFSIRVVIRCLLTDDQKARRQDHSWHRALLSLGN